MTTNLDHARALRERARAHPEPTVQRKALLVAAVCLSESRTPAGALKLLAAAQRLPEGVRDMATDLIRTSAAVIPTDANPKGNP